MSFLRRAVKNYTTVIPQSNLNISSFTPATGAGVDLSNGRSMQQAAVWACVRLRAETIGALPVAVVGYEGGNRVPVADPPWLVAPNPEMTRFELFERTSASIDVNGTAFWFLVRDNTGGVTEVWVLPPSLVTVFRDERSGRRRYRIGREKETYGEDEILQISGFSLPGRLRGLSPIDEHAHSIGLAVAAEEYGEAYFAKGSIMSGVIESPNDPGEVNATRMRNSFERNHRGVRNAHRPGFLFGGAKWVQLSIPNDAAQFLETRQFQLQEIARIFRVPPHKIGDLQRATFSNIEHQGIEWVQDGVLPYTTRIEAAVLHAGLIEPDQRLRFNFAGLLRGDTQSMYAAFAVGIQWGILSPDDCRALMDLNARGDGFGGTYLEPLNMVPAGTEREPAKALMSAKGHRLQLIDHAEEA